MDGSFRVDVGYQINLGFYRDFQSQDALAIVKFSNISEDIYKNCEFALFVIVCVIQAILMNENYTKYIIVMRAVFIVITAIAIILFTVRVKYFVSNIIIF